MKYGVVFKSISKVKHLPRPKLVRKVLFKGTRDECLDYLLEHAGEDQYQSTDEVEVLLEVRLVGRTKLESTSRRPGNGSR